MNEVLKFIAMNVPFDAAEYTWVHVTRSEVNGSDFEEVQRKLVAHGDYTLPLKLKHIKQPFEKIAVLHTYGRLKDGMPDSWERYMIFTLECKDSLPFVMKLWSSKAHALYHAETNKEIKLKDPVIAEAFFQPSIKDMEYHDIVGDKGLVRVSNDIPRDMRQIILDDLVATSAYALYYIACASYGLLEKEVTFYKPTAAGNNAKRMRKGKTPLYEWQTVPLHKPPPSLPSAPKGGTHASPRLHQRRGHWSVSKLGKKYWRRETVVGNPDNGMLFHDYTTKENPDARH